MIIDKIKHNTLYNKANVSFGKVDLDDDTIKGVLLNRYIQKQCLRKGDFDIDVISDSLMIPEKVPETKKKEEIASKFDYKKALAPILIATGATIAGFTAISAILSGYSNKLANNKGLVCPPDLATNVNILEEPHFALYRALIKPSNKNMLGFVGVCLFSGVTLAAKTLIDGASDVWVKKQQCDIEHDFQKNMIEVDRDVFTGKLGVVNKMLKNTSTYFKDVFTEKQKNTFEGFINFQGKDKTVNDNNKEKDEKKKTFKNLALIGATVAGITGISFLIFKNYQKTAQNLGAYVQKCEDIEIRANIEKALQNDDKELSILEMTNIMKSIKATKETIAENFSKISGITDDEIQKATKDILASQIYAVPPEALGGVSNKIQYYCYINEERGHLYNWILNPENPFNKYLFLGFSLVSSIGYISNKVADAVKKVAVSKENSKSELNMKRNLVEVEIENFKAKKESAINPLIENFNLQMQNGKPKEELKETAQNILIEIKKGPPYVYS